MSKAKRKIIAYRVDIDKKIKNSDTLAKKFVLDNMLENLVPYREDSPNEFLLLLIEKSSTEKIEGQFLKLRHISPQIINLSKKKIKDIILGDDENVLERSHFVYFIKDNVLFGEYNHEGIRYFSFNLSRYFNKVFDTDKSEVRPILNKETYKKLEKEKKIKSLSVRASPARMDFIEKYLGLDVAEVLDRFSDENGCDIEITLKGKRKSGLIKKAIIEIAKFLKTENEPAGIKKVKAVGLEGSLDLLRDNLFFYEDKFTVVSGSKVVDSNELYEAVNKFYEKHKKTIKEFAELE